MTHPSSSHHQEQEEIVVVYTPSPHVVDTERDDEDDDDFEIWQVGLERLEDSWVHTAPDQRMRHTPTGASTFNRIEHAPSSASSLSSWLVSLVAIAVTMLILFLVRSNRHVKKTKPTLTWNRRVVSREPRSDRKRNPTHVRTTLTEASPLKRSRCEESNRTHSILKSEPSSPVRTLFPETRSHSPIVSSTFLLDTKTRSSTTTASVSESMQQEIPPSLVFDNAESTFTIGTTHINPNSIRRRRTRQFQQRTLITQQHGLNTNTSIVSQQQQQQQQINISQNDRATIVYAFHNVLGEIRSIREDQITRLEMEQRQRQRFQRTVERQHKEKMELEYEREFTKVLDRFNDKVLWGLIIGGRAWILCVVVALGVRNRPLFRELLHNYLSLTNEDRLPKFIVQKICGCSNSDAMVVGADISLSSVVSVWDWTFPSIWPHVWDYVPSSGTLTCYKACAEHHVGYLGVLFVSQKMLHWFHVPDSVHRFVTASFLILYMWLPVFQEVVVPITLCNFIISMTCRILHSSQWGKLFIHRDKNLTLQERYKRMESRLQMIEYVLLGVCIGISIMTGYISS